MNKGTTITVKLEALAFGGALVGTIIACDDAVESLGKKAFVPFTLPGEVVTASVTKVSKSFVEADLLTVLEPSPERIAAPCPYFQECGGCQLQHMSIEQQRELKRNLVDTALQAKGIAVPSSAITLASKSLPAYAYRNRILVRLSPDGKLGFYRKGSAVIVPIERCLIASSAINQALERLHMIAKDIAQHIASISIEEAQEGEIVLVCNVREDTALKALDTVKQCIYPHFPLYSLKQKRKTIHSSFLDKKSAKKTYGHFSQVNYAGNEVLLNLVLSNVKDNTVDDLYAGDGNITFALAAAGANVRAVEFSKALVETGNRLAKTSQLAKQVTFIQSSCEKFVKSNALARTVVLDPPRAGAKEVVKRIRIDDTETIVYVSCSPPTFTRDAQVLQEKGYVLKKVNVLDMFPQTFHIELVSLWRRG